jgi:hypothetical protein
MDFIDYTWDQIEGAFVKENILGSEFSFSTKTDMNVSIDYIPKNQARKIFTYAKEQLDILKNGAVAAVSVMKKTQLITLMNLIIVVETEEVTSFTEIMPVTHHHLRSKEPFDTVDSFKENGLAGLSQEVI